MTGLHNYKKFYDLKINHRPSKYNSTLLHSLYDLLNFFHIFYLCPSDKFDLHKRRLSKVGKCSYIFCFTILNCEINIVMGASVWKVCSYSTDNLSCFPHCTQIIRDFYFLLLAYWVKSFKVFVAVHRLLSTTKIYGSQVTVK